MNLLLLSFVISYCTLAATSPLLTRSAQLFGGFPGHIADIYQQDLNIKGFLSNIEALKTNLPKNFTPLINQLISLNNQWVAVSKQLEAAYAYLVEHLAEYKTNQKGIYKFPSGKIQTIISLTTKVATVEQAIDQILTKLNSHSGSLSGLSWLCGPSTNNGAIAALINEVGSAAKKTSGLVSMLRNFKSEGSTVRINLSDLNSYVYKANGVEPNFFNVIRNVITQNLKKQSNNI